MAITTAARSLTRNIPAIVNPIFNFLFPLRCPGCNALLALDDDARICPSCAASIQPPRPPLCLRCGVPLAIPADICERCRRDPPYFGKARALACYQAHPPAEPDILGSLLRRHKYGANQALAASLAQLLRRGVPMADAYDVVIPVPLHPRRLRWRGFNQSALFAAPVASVLGCRLDTASLVRVIPTKPQTAQDLASRRRNVHNAFAVRYPQAVANRKILLVDDVLTTGATVNECARVLNACGAREVDVLTIARAL
jgi:ComF family protein